MSPPTEKTLPGAARYFAAGRISAPSGAAASPPTKPRATDYNRPVTLPHPAGAETLWRDDALYDLVAVTSHNSNPIVPGAGSAIFVHIAGGADYPPTEGCIAFARADLEAILRDWIPGRDTIAIA